VAAKIDFSLADGVTSPERTSGPLPTYTEVGRKARVTGNVILGATITEVGGVEGARILKGLPMGLDRAALEAVQGWKFKPATLSGTPVKVLCEVTISFQLGSGAPYGPSFMQMLTQGTFYRFGDYLLSGEYQKALSALEKIASMFSVDGPETILARCHLLLAMGSVTEALELASSARAGHSPTFQHEALLTIGSYALELARGKRDDRIRASLLDLGLRAQERAIVARPDSRDARLLGRQLLQEKIRSSADAAERRKLAETIERLDRELAALPPSPPWIELL
jgi:TonB family protein